MVATARATMNRRRLLRARSAKDLAQKGAKGAARTEGKAGSRKGGKEGVRLGRPVRLTRSACLVSLSSPSPSGQHHLPRIPN